MEMFLTDMIHSQEEEEIPLLDVYGIDPDGPIPELANDDGVVIPETNISLTQEETEVPQYLINPLTVTMVLNCMKEFLLSFRKRSVHLYVCLVLVYDSFLQPPFLYHYWRGFYDQVVAQVSNS